MMPETRNGEDCKEALSTQGDRDMRTVSDLVILELERGIWKIRASVEERRSQPKWSVQMEKFGDSGIVVQCL